MSWVNPRTWAGDLATSAIMNEIRDALRASGGARTTTLPTLTDENEWLYPADTTNGVVWQLKYNAGSASGFKWEFIGGAPMFTKIDTSETVTTPTVYTDAPTVGPSVTVPRAGDYEVWIGADFASTQGNTDAFIAVKRGAAAAVDLDSMVDHTGSAIVATHSRMLIITGLAASDVLKMQYKTGSLNVTCKNRWMAVRPIRVS